MKIIGKVLLDDFVHRHADARTWIESWIPEVEEAEWTTSQHIRNRFASARFLPCNVVIFNVRGNNYRMEVQIAYRTGNLRVIWVGTHAEYDQRNRDR